MEGVTVRELEDIKNDQGSLQHMLRSDDSEFTRFGEVYFSTIKPDVVKGWHKHLEQTSVLSCISGKVKLVLYDGKEFLEVVFGDGERKVVTIAPGVVYGWKNLAETDSMIANCASHPHDPDKSEKIPLEEISYDW